MKLSETRIDPLTGERYEAVFVRGHHLLSEPLLNKGTAFDHDERRCLGLEGLLQPAVNPIQVQVERVMENFHRKPTNIERYIYLIGLLDRNETLFYRVLLDHLEQLLPIVYTPTVGEACQKMSHIFRRPRGVYITPQNVGRAEGIFDRADRTDVHLIVVTDGERILGLGDLGSDGMGIPIGKIGLYVAAAGINPAVCLPICLDVGTNNESLLQDPLYLGERHRRLTGAEYDAFVERFVVAVRRAMPGALVQWEDFGKGNAFRLLDRYAERVPSFNDDIQGTGATALAALLSAVRIKGEGLADQRVVIAGFGQAGVGIARAVTAALESGGLDPCEARRRIYPCDLGGLLTDDTPGLTDAQRPFARPAGEIRAGSIAEVVEAVKATVLVGVTATPGLFDASVLSALARSSTRPVLFSLSNPNTRAECTPEQAIDATAGRALVATGSPFAPVVRDGRTVPVAQVNNLYIFPGVGLGALVAHASRVTDEMFLAASRALSELAAEEGAPEALLPPMADIRRVSARVALAVARVARDRGIGLQASDERLAESIERAQWRPEYVPFRAADGPPGCAS